MTPEELSWIARTKELQAKGADLAGVVSESCPVCWRPIERSADPRICRCPGSQPTPDAERWVLHGLAGLAQLPVERVGYSEHPFA